ncbi:MAG: hypothetical protein RIQ94_1384 [Pseudomonadota bacterium]
MKKRIMVIGLVLFIVSLLVTAKPPKQVSSVDQVSKQIKSKAGLQQYNEQMSGTAKPDGFGALLPTGLTAKEIVALIAPTEDLGLATLVGAKAWPYRPNSFVAIACFAKTKAVFDSDKDYNKEPACKRDYDPNQKNGIQYVDQSVYLGVLEYKADAIKPALIASYGKPLDIKTSWKSSQLEGPSQDVDEGDEINLMPEEYMRLDFALFKLTDTDTAIGLRLGWNEGYAGGSGYFEALSLFKIDGTQLINILSEPIYYYQDLAGYWHNDGTRDHELYEGQNVLSFLPSKTQGYYDIQIKTQDSKWKKGFQWDNKAERYIAVAATAKTKKD